MECVLEAEHLTKTYGVRQAVDRVSFKIHQGEVVGFLGPNGAGKTTTMRMLAGLIRPTSGWVRVLGRGVPGPGLRSLGTIIEEPAFYPYLSGRDNLRYAAKIYGGLRRTRIDEVLELVGLAQRAGDRVFKYSQGMRQRLGLARALLTEPKVLMLDEPTNGLDPEGIAEIRRVIKHFGEAGITVFVSSHILAEVQKFARRVLIINEGRLLADGALDELFTPFHGDVEYLLETTESARALERLSLEPWVNFIRTDESGLRFRIPSSAAYRLAPMLVTHGVPFTELRREGGSGSLEDYYLEIISQKKPSLPPPGAPALEGFDA